MEYIIKLRLLHHFLHHEHLKHSMCDNEATKHVDSSKEDGEGPKKEAGAKEWGSELNNTTTDDDTRHGVGDRHERCVEGRSDIPDDHEPDLNCKDKDDN